MPVERFRVWIVVLITLFLLTLWVKMGFKTYKWQHKGGMHWKKHAMMEKMSGMCKR